MWRSLLSTLPRGYTLEEDDWRRRHRLVLRLLAVHVPGLATFGLLLGRPWTTVAVVLTVPVACVVGGVTLRRHRRFASVLVTLGLVWCSGALVGFSDGAIEAHFHFFVIIGFIALYQDWAPFLCNVAFVVISHGIGSFWQQSLIFNHSAGQQDPWLWSLIHGVAVLFACFGMMLFWRFTEESQQEGVLAKRLAEAEINRRRFTADLLLNLARRNQGLLYRQLDIINQLEETERDPDALAELFTLDHLATRVRRNAESLLVLSGERSPRTWSVPVPLRDVIRASIAETEDLDRVEFVVDERTAVIGHAVTDITHLLAELIENAVRFSPPDTVVTLRARADRSDPGAQVLTVEDWGVGMPPDELAAANALLADPPEIDLSVFQRLGLHVIARLAARHSVRVSLSATPGSGVTAVVALPAQLFGPSSAPAVSGGSRPAEPAARTAAARIHRVAALRTDRAVTNGAAPEGAVLTREIPPERGPFGSDGPWPGWWQPGQGDPASTLPPLRPLPAAHVPSTREAPSTRETPSSGAGAPSRAGSDVPVAHLTPRPRPQPPGERPAGAEDGLRRRVPQAHLVPELRVMQPEPEPAADPVQAADAAAALSRYQASRRAAQDAENGHPR